MAVQEDKVSLRELGVPKGKEKWQGNFTQVYGHGSSYECEKAIRRLGCLQVALLPLTKV